MSNVREKHNWMDLSGDALRQYIDTRSVFTAWEDAKIAAAEVRGGMYWQQKNGKEYLIRTATNNSQKSLGPRSKENEAIYKNFFERKERVEKRLTELNAELTRHQRMNRALRVGRAPRLLVEILDKIYKSGLAEYFTVVGTSALYAYEAAAGVRFGGPDAKAPGDIDFLWEGRKRLNFLSEMKSDDTSFLALLKKVDPTFAIRPDRRHTAVNSKGFEINVIPREFTGNDQHPLTVNDEEEYFYVVQARRAGILTDSSTFTALVISINGHIVRMRTTSPTVFVKFKRWMGVQPDSDPLKRRRDILQAELVEKLIEKCLPKEI